MKSGELIRQNKKKLKKCDKRIQEIFNDINFEYRIIKTTKYSIIAELVEKTKIDIAKFAFVILKKSSELKINLRWEGFNDEKKYNEFTLLGDMQRVLFPEEILPGIYERKTKKIKI